MAFLKKTWRILKMPIPELLQTLFWQGVKQYLERPGTQAQIRDLVADQVAAIVDAEIAKLAAGPTDPTAPSSGA